MTDNFVGRMVMQPKKEIVSFLASKGVRTAIVYDSPEKHLDKMLRSEHPQDYEGSSDLFPKGFLKRRRLKKGESIADLVLSEGSPYLSQRSPYMERVMDQIYLHCKLQGINYVDFIKDLSYSAWERIEGTNRTICSDSAIKDRYHIITLANSSYDVVEGSKIEQMTNSTSIGLKVARGLIKMYEQVRRALDPNHCYIVETQSVENADSTFDHFVVQAHRGRDFQKVDFKAESQGWGVIPFNVVRGATSPAGENLLLTLRYPEKFRREPEIIVEDASTQASEHYIARAFSEIMFRKRKLQIFGYRDDDLLQYELANHCSRNSLLKPACSVLTYFGGMERLHRLLPAGEGLAQVRVNFISDGRQAYLQLPDKN